jgi:hypothetical protein
MRKSTIVLLVIVIGAGVALTWLLDAYVGHAEAELRNGRDLTEAHRADLAAGSRVRLRRVKGEARYPVKVPERPGLIVEAEPSALRWAKDASAYGIARDLAERAIRLYAPDHAITWVLLRLRRPDGSQVLHAFEPGDGGDLVAIPTGDVVPRPGASPAHAPSSVEGAGPPPAAPGGPGGSPAPAPPPVPPAGTAPAPAPAPSPGAEKPR